MKIVIAANGLMRQMAHNCISSAQKLGYSVVVYDLGGLGFGKPFAINNPSFQEKGYYQEIFLGRYSPGLHKASVIKDFLKTNNEFMVYLDADTLMLKRIDEMQGNYDIGLTVRPQWEIGASMTDTNSFIYNGYINNGIMSFNPTERTFHFLDMWEKAMERIPEDQGAMNDLFKEIFPIRPNQIVTLEGIKIRTFDTVEYNYYYFNSSKNLAPSSLKQAGPWSEAKILHFKGKTRSKYSRILFISKFLSVLPRSLTALFKKILKTFIIQTNPFWPFSKINQLPYFLAINYWINICKKYPQIKNVYLRNSMIDGNWTPGISDIDLTVTICNDMSPENELIFLRAFWKKHQECSKLFPILGEVEIFDEQSLQIWKLFGLRGYESRSWKSLYGEKSTIAAVTPANISQEALHYALHVFKTSFWKEFSDKGTSLQNLQRATKKALKYIHYQDSYQKYLTSSDLSSKESMLCLVIKELSIRISRSDTNYEAAKQSLKDPVISVLFIKKGIFTPSKETGHLIIIKDDLKSEELRDCVNLNLKRFYGQIVVILPRRIFEYILRIQDPFCYYAFLENAQLESGEDILSSIRPPESAFLKQGALNKFVSVLSFSRRPKAISHPPSRNIYSFYIQEALRAKLFLDKNEIVWDRDKLLDKYKDIYPEYYNELSTQPAFKLMNDLTASIKEHLL